MAQVLAVEQDLPAASGTGGLSLRSHSSNEFRSNAAEQVPPATRKSCHRLISQCLQDDQTAGDGIAFLRVAHDDSPDLLNGARDGLWRLEMQIVAGVDDLLGARARQGREERAR